MGRRPSGADLDIKKAHLRRGPPIGGPLVSYCDSRLYLREPGFAEGGQHLYRCG